ncbi:MAG TPA: 3'-5' exonuclease, partial [Syntrophorhabdales bacterium]|nr:3'-5' exonuclease [Syntrophorhabdales bacterium]
MDDLDLAIVDVETTGVTPSSDRIIEVAVVRVSGGKVVEEFSSLVDPERQISPRIWSLTGITDEDLRDAPLFRQIKDDLLRLLD